MYSGNPDTEYVIFRKWQHFLVLQDMIETEYSAKAREKRHRLSA